MRNTDSSKYSIAHLTEPRLINKLYDLILEEKKRGKHGWLKNVYKNKNLTTKEFKDIWLKWWKGPLPPSTEVDIILIFEDPMQVIDKALIGSIEIEYFSSKDLNKKNFYVGLQQVLAFSIFGFDGLSLWHVFAPEIEENVIENYATTASELISGFKLPIFYLAMKIQNKEDFRLKCFEPTRLENTLEYYIDWLNKYWIVETNRNPLLQRNEIRNRRNLLKTILKVPV